ncbi:putative transmembrane protein [Streptococcus equi subsp. zooepidemicus MGCS10565]|uniref:Transmembrane protein n=2 Tax=Streptococcus equi subsp. zooepidemicus TaxID=40041 RepID=B4U3K4_STREM|nr:putative transmembrane protein [Streptococcus equi subsp. zooepidemicus MGCS10565]BAJ84570.1 putative transmembrane protein [Streptococcus equi subsp. zooepidemicus]
MSAHRYLFRSTLKVVSMLIHKHNFIYASFANLSYAVFASSWISFLVFLHYNLKAQKYKSI